MQRALPLLVMIRLYHKTGNNDRHGIQYTNNSIAISASGTVPGLWISYNLLRTKPIPYILMPPWRRTGLLRLGAGRTGGMAWRTSSTSTRNKR